ncbi:unnamed protein product [Albugo candida]|uniref:Uncharacterized protein n=1 Tax=Albugo candida TaxID=65357 RepID=A0A024G664_9STRA|nr:unnamed protein product [Albugo candida]|eukprot:CCI42247.1 unnamed protein product [Albugo candida]
MTLFVILVKRSALSIIKCKSLMYLLATHVLGCIASILVVKEFAFIAIDTRTLRNVSYAQRLSIPLFDSIRWFVHRISSSSIFISRILWTHDLRMDTDSIRFCREDSTYLKCFPKVPLSRWQPHRSES